MRCRIKKAHGAVRKPELLSIVLRYDKSYFGLLQSKLIVFPNFDDYASYRKSEPFEFK